MKLITLLPLAALGSSFVIVNEEVLSRVTIETNEASKSFLKKLPTKDGVVSFVEETVHDAVKYTENAFDTAMNAASDATAKAQSSFESYTSMTGAHVKSWIDSAETAIEDLIVSEDSKRPDHPRHPPHHKKPDHHHHGKPNMTVYELINSSKYTTKLAKLINEYDDLIDLLNGTSANFTVFAPTDDAFEKIPDHHRKPSKELIKNILTYHVSGDFYPAGRVLVTHTIPTLYHEERLGGEQQRLRVGLGLKGLAVNFYSRIVAINIFGTNGVIHGIDSLLITPPPVLKIIELLPGEFSTLQLALTKTGLLDVLEKAPHTGGTLFAPSNYAFQKLGPKINAFLFSKYGEKYLASLLKYHVVANQTLYSDAFYKGKDSTDATDIPKGRFHVDLPTLLDDKSLSIDIARFGGFITIKINGFGSVAVQDGLASDGVIQVVGNVLIPPKTPGGAAYMGEEMSVEELKGRLEAVEPRGWFDL